MPEPVDSRVAVYIDFDNIVISRYAQVHPANRRDQLSTFTDDALMKARLNDATVDIGAILDYASKFGTVVITRAYADWSLAVNSAYRDQLVGRAVDLVQMFPTSSTKNGADIRLAVDVVEDVFRLPALTHVVIVAGDSDYISLAQRAKRMNCYVVGIGVAGSISSALESACDSFTEYDDIPGVEKPLKRAAPRAEPAVRVEPVKAEAAAAAGPKAGAAAPKIDRDLQSLRDKADALLKKALDLVEADEDGWRHSSAVKLQMKRIDPKFNEKALGFTTFTQFVESRPKLVEVKQTAQARMLKLH